MDKQSGYNSGEGGKQTILQEEYTWKIMNKKGDGTVEIMGVPDSSKTEIWLEGATGYNNGVYLLNDICEKLYSNSELGVEARSINLDDIESHMTEAGKNARNEYTSGGNVKYGGTKTYEGTYANYPKLAKYENNINIDDKGFGNLTGSEDGTSLKEQEIDIPLEESDSSKEKASNSLTVKETDYSVTPDATYFENNGNLYTDLFFNTDTFPYWLASRFSDCGSTFADFGLRYVIDGDIDSCFLFFSQGDTYSHHGSLAPVVSLGSNIQFTEYGENGWNLSIQQ